MFKHIQSDFCKTRRQLQNSISKEKKQQKNVVFANQQLTPLEQLKELHHRLEIEVLMKDIERLHADTQRIYDNAQPFENF